jgi:hypothetical protein
VSFNLGQAAAGFNPGSTIGSFGSNASSGAFGLGQAAAGGFGGAQQNSGGFFDNLGKVAGKFGGFFGNVDDDNTLGQAAAIANLQGQYGIQAANINNMAAEVAAQNAQNSLLTDYNLQRIAKGDRQRFNTNRFGRQENLMAVVPQLVNNVAYATKNPNVGAAMGAQLAGMIG